MREWIPVPGTAKSRLVEAAIHQFEMAGYEAVNVTELAAKASVTTGSLYHHFDSKLGLYLVVREEMERRVVDRMVGAAAASSEVARTTPEAASGAGTPSAARTGSRAGSRTEARATPPAEPQPATQTTSQTDPQTATQTTPSTGPQPATQTTSPIDPQPAAQNTPQTEPQTTPPPEPRTAADTMPPREPQAAARAATHAEPQAAAPTASHEEPRVAARTATHEDPQAAAPTASHEEPHAATPTASQAESRVAVRAALLVAFDAAVHFGVCRILAEPLPVEREDPVAAVLHPLLPKRLRASAAILAAAWRAALLSVAGGLPSTVARSSLLYVLETDQP